MPGVRARIGGSRLRRWWSGTAVAVILLPVAVVAPGNAAATPAPTTQPYDFSREKGKALGTHGPLPQGFSRTEITVKFRTERRVRVRGGKAVAGNAADAAALTALLDRYPGMVIDRLMTRSEQEVAAEQDRLKKRLGREVADLNSWFVITVPHDIEGVLAALNRMPAVEIAQARALTRTPSEPLRSHQHYRNAVGASTGTGIDADHAATLSGGKGDGITITDVEGGGDYVPNPSRLPGSLAASDGHSLMVTAEAQPTVWAWGDNSQGQLGDGSTTSRTTMTQVKGLSGVKAVSAGDGFSVALTTDGSVWTWGDNSKGQLGDGTTTTRRTTPAKVPELDGLTVTAISAGRDGHVLAVLESGAVVAWGTGTSGQLGNGSDTNSTTPVLVTGLSDVSTTPGAIAAGYGFSTAVLTDGTVKTWGDGGFGQLGNGQTTDSDTPVNVSGITNATQVASGGGHSLALLSDRSVKAWGLGVSGQLGDGGNTNRTTPVPVSGLADATGVFAGTFHSGALKTDHTLWTWGDNGHGQLGNGTPTDSNVPIRSAIDTATAAMGLQHTVAVLRSDQFRAWGGNGDGQLGDGTTTSSSDPIVPTTLLNVWNVCHEDLAGRPAPYGPPVWLKPLAGDRCRPGDHGTPVVGITSARDDNGVGMAGVAPHARLQLGLFAANGVAAAVDASGPGDVILLEGVGWTHSAALGHRNYPVEVFAEYYTLVTRAVDKGVTVIEPAGNEGNSLDSTTDPFEPFTTWKPKPDTGAIVVGWGEPPGGTACKPGHTPPALTASVKATHGSRVDLQGYGECAATIGTPAYKNLTPNETDPSKQYRDNFNGASAASPIVAGAAAVLQGIAKQSGKYLDPRQMRDLLVSTGTPQPAGDPRHIGPLPNLKAAIAKLNGPTGPIASGIAGKCVNVDQGGTANGTAVQLWTCDGSARQVWTMNPNGNIQSYGKCLDVTSSGTANGTKVQLWECNDSGAQQWTYNATTKALTNPQSGRCLDVPGSTTTDGTQLQIYDCNQSNAQRWTIPA
ncbi:ricin-type beta-trefoil lectin domain protein [Thermomonospora umbrina]|uniref:Alpha-tubulin suppressor-like RCC1 family protein n=1 Tax=Thermomonospora umbrina TaxID=111806 RepID=A0A3D9SZE1_9ACTN|nr:ricin-type beta-trefoil lectin domain protein [Thermomonospora umbrina]REE98345.1 alpha-tubulin suppressor-like RCC1 family protein [Thermomonospora umbrina]